MNTIKWSELSRNNSLRMYEVFNNMTKLQVTSYDVNYYSCSCTNNKKVLSVDPDGGPYLGVGDIIKHNKMKWKIVEVLSHKKIQSVAVFIFEVVTAEND